MGQQVRTLIHHTALSVSTVYTRSATLELVSRMAIIMAAHLRGLGKLVQSVTQDTMGNIVTPHVISTRTVMLIWDVTGIQRFALAASHRTGVRYVNMATL